MHQTRSTKSTQHTYLDRMLKSIVWKSLPSIHLDSSNHTETSYRNDKKKTMQLFSIRRLFASKNVCVESSPHWYWQIESIVARISGNVHEKAEDNSWRYDAWAEAIIACKNANSTPVFNEFVGFFTNFFGFWVFQT